MCSRVSSRVGFRACRKALLDLGEGLPGRIETGRTARQEQEPGTGRPDRLSDRRRLTGAELAHDDNVTRLEPGHELFSTQARKHRPSIGPSKTQAAVSRSQRNAPRSASAGGRAGQSGAGAPFGHRPRNGAALVSIQYRRAIDRADRLLPPRQRRRRASARRDRVARLTHRCRLRATQARACPTVRGVVPEPKAVASRARPHRLVGTVHPARRGFMPPARAASDAASERCGRR